MTSHRLGRRRVTLSLQLEDGSTRDLGKGIAPEHIDLTDQALADLVAAEVAAAVNIQGAICGTDDVDGETRPIVVGSRFVVETVVKVWYDPAGVSIYLYQGPEEGDIFLAVDTGAGGGKPPGWRRTDDGTNFNFETCASLWLKGNWSPADLEWTYCPDLAGAVGIATYDTLFGFHLAAAPAAVSAQTWQFLGDGVHQQHAQAVA